MYEDQGATTVLSSVASSSLAKFLVMTKYTVCDVLGLIFAWLVRLTISWLQLSLSIPPASLAN